MPKIEILAPVGSEEMLRAAVFSGADAVYLGFAGFNARTGAGNFTADSLKEAVRFCHVRGVKVHVPNWPMPCGPWPKAARMPSSAKTLRWPSSSGRSHPGCPATAPPR